MIERIASISEIERSFAVTEMVEVAVKPRGFNLWCKLPYPKHPHGCPNFGIRKDCPPNQPYFLDIYKPQVKIAVLKFDFESYLGFRKSVHPDWTDRALRNPLYFQDHLNAQLEAEIKQLKKIGNIEGFVPEKNTEAMGVNIHLTCERAGIHLEWPPKYIMHRVRILAQPIK